MVEWQFKYKGETMKLLRVGEKGKEKPAILDTDGKIRDISSHINDLNP